MNQDFVRKLRTLLILGRVSNLPTVWSNCLAGWWLGGGGNFWKLPLLFFGISYVARRESFRGPIPYWPLVFLAAPILAAMVMNVGNARKAAMFLSVIFALWIARCVRTVFQTSERREINVGKIVSGLLAGIV